MDEAPTPQIIPAWMQQMLSLVLTLAAALLYLGILGYAIVRSFIEPEPIFTVGAMRAAQLLSGLVGSVVTAGFARGRGLPVSVMSAARSSDSSISSARTHLSPLSHTTCKFIGLGEVVGFRALPSPPRKSRPGESEQLQTSLSLWVGLIYFAVYFLVGIGALALVLIKPEVPEFIGNAAWVWLGTLVAAGYSFFSLSGND